MKLYMKTFLIAAGLLSLIASCSTENETVSKTLVRTDEKGRELGLIPAGHKVYDGMKAEVTLNDYDALYRSEFDHPDSASLDYNNSVKSVAFAFIMMKGLAENGTPEQKLYYLEQQASLDSGLSEQFYVLLASCKGSVANIKLEKLDKKFYNKNLKVAASIQELRPYEKDEFISLLKDSRAKYKGSN